MTITKTGTTLRADSARIGFIGFGNMATAMAQGLIASGKVAPSRIYCCAGDFQRLIPRADALGADLIGDKPIVSVAAGWSSDDYESILPGSHHLSTMPNTPVAVNEGVIICEKDHTLNERQVDLVRFILGYLGTLVDVDASMMSAAGTVTGCSPAFVAMVIEALADAAVKHGIPRNLAYTLVSQTVAGTAKLQLSTGQHPGAMKDAVCSPGGTTIKGVAALEQAGLRSAFIQAIDAIEGK